MTEFGWYQFKLFVERASGISMDALHMIAGLAIFLVAAAIARRSIASPLPLLVLLFLEVANEFYDLNVERWPDLGMQLGEGAKDLVLTMALPAVLWVAARRWPQLFNPNGSDAGA